MKLAVDYSPAIFDRAGIGNYTRDITQALAEKLGSDLLVITPKELPSGFLGDAQVIVVKWPRLPFLKGLRWLWKAGKVVNQLNATEFLSISTLTASLVVPNVIQIIHDISPVTTPQVYPYKHRFLFKLGCFVTIYRAKALAFVSETTQREFIRAFPTNKPQQVILAGVSELDADQSPDPLIELPNQYIVSISTIQPRKNYENMLRAFAVLAKQNNKLQYLIGGKRGWYFENLASLVKQLGIEKQVRFLGFISDTQKLELLKHAKAFVYASIEEGFGIPNLEAYAYGAPVVTSDIPVIREVMQDKAILVDPLNYMSIAKGLMQAVEQGRQSPNQKWLQQYTWAATADRLIKFLQLLHQ